MNSFGNGGIFMVLTKKKRPNILNLIFQTHSHFEFHEFTFIFIEREPNSDIVKYTIYETGKPDVRVRIVFPGLIRSVSAGQRPVSIWFNFVGITANDTIQ